MGLTLVSAPADTPVSLDTVKQQVRVTGSSRDDLLTLYLEAAVDRVERFLGRSLIDQTWDYYADAFPTDGAQIEIPRPPLIEITGVFYTDDDGVEQEVAASDYYTGLSVGGLSLLVPASGSWPTPGERPNAVRIRFRSGYLDTGVSPAEQNVPSAIKAAILLYVGDLYAHRETLVVEDQIGELPNYVDGMLRPYRVRLGMA